MPFKFLKHRWQKVTALISLFIISLVLIIGLLVNRYWSSVLAGKVKDVVSKSSDGLYTISFSSAELNVLSGSIVLYNITLKPDTAIYNAKRNQHLAPNNLIQLHIKRLTVSHIHPLRLYFQHKLNIGQIIINKPELNMSYQLNHTKDTVVKDSRTAWKRISKSLNSIHVASILLDDIKFKYEDYSGHKLAISELKEMNLSATDLLIDSATQTDKSRLLYCRDIITRINNYSGKTPNGLYSYKITSLTLSTLKSKLLVEGLILIPVSATLFFGKTLNNRFTIQLDSLQLNHFDFLNYYKYRTLSASSIVLSNGGIEIFGNPRTSADRSDRVRTFPNFGLDRINADMKIDTVLTNQINIIYTEFNEKSKKTGSISFNNTVGQFLNITTNKAALQKNSISQVKLTSNFMNRGKLNLKFNFNLADTNNAFTYKGTLGVMNLQSVNEAIMPLAMIKITSGTLNRFSFDVKANRTLAKGKIEILYNNLKVILLKPDTAFNKLKHQTIASMFANLFIFKHDNPDKPSTLPRTFNITYVRPAETPFFKYLWQTLLSGIKPSVGLNKKTTDATIYMISKQVINKQNRKIKKTQRKLRREQRRKKRELWKSISG